MSTAMTSWSFNSSFYKVSAVLGACCLYFSPCHTIDMCSSPAFAIQIALLDRVAVILIFSRVRGHGSVAEFINL